MGAGGEPAAERSEDDDEGPLDADRDRDPEHDAGEPDDEHRDRGRDRSADDLRMNVERPVHLTRHLMTRCFSCSSLCTAFAVNGFTVSVYFLPWCASWQTESGRWCL